MELVFISTGFITNIHIHDALPWVSKVVFYVHSSHDIKIIYKKYGFLSGFSSILSPNA
jgi:hypothetical protein